MAIIRKGQNYAHRSNRLYYEILHVTNGIVHYLLSRGNWSGVKTTPLETFEGLIEEGTLLRD